MSVRKGRSAACLCSESKPGAAVLRGSPDPPLSRQISLCCSALRRSSWQLKFYPSWEGRRGWGQRAGTTQKSTLLSQRWQDIYSQFLAQTPRILSPSPVCRRRYLLGQDPVTPATVAAFNFFYAQFGPLLPRWRLTKTGPGMQMRLVVEARVQKSFSANMATEKSS